MKPNYINGFSIVIPSFNREKQLIRLLDSIFEQDISPLYEIVVLDNNSDYDIYEVLKSFSSSKLRIVRNTFNVKMGTNMMSTFLHCKTKWMWLISDDDVICKGAISIVEKKIKENSEESFLKFSSKGIGNTGVEKNKKVNNLEQFIDYYHNDKKIRRGNLVFVSNGVFNIESLYPFLGYGFEFSYTYIPYLIPVFMSLNSNKSMVFSEEKIIKFMHPENGSWSFVNVGLGLSTLSHLPLKLDKKYFKKFLNITMAVTFIGLFLYILKKDLSNSRRIYNIIYNNIYKYYLTPFQKIISFILSLLLFKPKLFKSLLLKITKK